MLPPENSQIELTVIGPSYGESICFHPGGGRWWIIDSCLDPTTREPAPVAYLEALGVDVAKQVDLIIATHWHDDHVAGLAKTLARCPTARFCLSSVLTRPEFYRFVAQYQQNPPRAPRASLFEMDQIFDMLRESNRDKRRAAQGLLLHRLDKDVSGHGHDCTITALSPSDHAQDDFIREIVRHIPGVRDTKRPAPSLSPNNASVALWIEIGAHRILLGADLEDAGNHQTGWKAYLAADNCPTGKAELFKVPHHGSKNAHNDELWASRLAGGPLTVTTPWYVGGRSLPTDADKIRIRDRSSAALLTAELKSKKVSGRPNVVDKQLKSSGIKLRPIPMGFGSVRCRTAPGASAQFWCVECFNSAFVM